MTQLGLTNTSLFSSQNDHALLQQHTQAARLTEIMDASHEAKQKEPIIRSPASTVADDDLTSKTDAAALAAAYRARIALAAASPASTAAPSNQLRGTPTARLLTFVNSPLPTPTVHGTDQNIVQSLDRKWRTLYGGLKSNSQAAADVLMKQAQATSQLEELVQALFIQLKASTEDRVRLQQLLLQERAQFMAQVEEAQQLQQRLHTSEHRSTAVKVVTESLQSQLVQARDALEASNRERQQMAEQLAIATECRTRGDALIAEQTAVMETLRQQLEEQASAMSSLAEDKAQLEAQLQSVLRAEQELTVHLRETHAAIEGQLAALREQLKGERQKRAAVVKRRGELQAQVEQLQGKVAAQQADMAALTDKLIRGGLSHLALPRAAPVATTQSTALSAPKPGAQAGALARTSSVGSAAHMPHSRGAAAASVQGAAAVTAQQRARSTLRSSSLGQTNTKKAFNSPTFSGGGSAIRPLGQERTSSPPGPGLEETAGPDNAPAVAFRVPSSLPSPEASFAITSAPGIGVGRTQQDLSDSREGAHIATPVATTAPAHTSNVMRGTAEPPSPPITLASARETVGLSMEPGSAGLNRRRSASPEASRPSANARRTGSVSGRGTGGRATSPSRGVGNNTWFP
ncbi:hypothetical protein Vretimale_19354 [Volvox reticuliferus]|uniref:Uncharacterized protein n=1 Tax=Volvox reticuliferus TaxID=1737510 RepID=A0A8J4GWR0_9CHLO|nr:hypothetical protein Vretifemale_19935 [Volvox reticuliferus]GIM16762.1 hypothetical protein Vretimale_19354 [Volvox reticuliferus]